MELDRNTIILLCIGFIIVWVVFKRFSKKPQQPQDPHQQRHAAPAATPGNGSFDLDKWFGRAQDVIGIMADTRRTDLEAQWRRWTRNGNSYSPTSSCAVAAPRPTPPG